MNVWSSAVLRLKINFKSSRGVLYLYKLSADPRFALRKKMSKINPPYYAQMRASVFLAPSSSEPAYFCSECTMFMFETVLSTR